MEPNDQYLCIVPKPAALEAVTDGSASGAGGIRGRGRAMLPFEGDRTLSVVLSKALVLAEDDRIKDPTITRQIGGG